jgi:hypothetical protein
MSRKQIAWTYFAIFMGICVIAGLAIGPSDEMKKKYPHDGLTDAQYLAVVDHCNQKPKPWDC